MRKSFLLPLALVAALCGTAFSGVGQANAAPPDVSFGKLYLTVFLETGRTETDLRLLSFFARSPILRSIAEQTVFHVYTNDSPLIKRTEWQLFLGKRRPAVLLQGLHDGHGKATVLFFVNRLDEVPTAKALETQIVIALQTYAKRLPQLKRAEQCPLPRRPTPTPAPTPRPSDPPPPAVEPKPLDQVLTPPPGNPANSRPLPAWVLGLLPLFGALAGAWHETRRV